MPKPQKRHKPPHYYFDNQIYSITASTYQKKPLFGDRKKKAMLKSVIREKAEAFGVKIFAFVLSHCTEIIYTFRTHLHAIFVQKIPYNIPIFFGIF